MHGLRTLERLNEQAAQRRAQQPVSPQPVKPTEPVKPAIPRQ